MPLKLFICLLGLVSLPTLAAPPVLQQQEVSLALAQDLINETLRQCQAQGRDAVVAVVDRGGNLVALQRADNIGPHNSLAAQRKAYTALSTKTKTSELAERARTTPTAQNLVTLPELLLLGGGLPLKVQGQVIGAIGVAGTGSADADDQCALRAIAKLLPNS
ncbi:GlcG/HbpS family heme-binding protein [Bordetella avium]|uniref:Exported protein n=1 Tax=Bordetella avium (strain 197N) TaxID=360910 RepID=Q2KZP9_BORA1|nr:heme-binding protein [Bordetella avium]AZY49371.1 heme-binding protein [Bordetella avium]AZY52724.1 heme-binding protein [Bordetella avium]RIQ12849.1 heme-binding protein [Bordetella avium]RIQ19116.1 heme-binding protein [Bordetella avium]RIQ32027.1 heme-binding protein [Bordetella avium]